MFRAIVLFCIAISSASYALDGPLTLKQAIDIAKNNNLSLKKELIKIDDRKIDLDSLNGKYDLSAKIDLKLAKRDEFNDRVNDSNAFLHLTKVLYDENNEIAIDSKQSSVQDQEFLFKLFQQQHDIKVMDAFYNVILADLKHETILQLLAHAAVRGNRTQEAFDINEASEEELLAKQAKTQIEAVKWVESESNQIITRAKLASLLNLPYEKRPDVLKRPRYKDIVEKDLEDFGIWNDKVKKNNPTLKNLERQLSDLNSQYSLENSNHEITITSTARIGEQGYQRDKNGELRFGVGLSMPLGDSSSQSSKLSKLRNEINNQKLAIEIHKQNLTNEALELWSKLKTLKRQNNTLKILINSKDLSLELARAEYEMLMKTDIGMAMIEVTDAEWQMAKNEFDFVLTLTKLKQLAGENYEL